LVTQFEGKPPSPSGKSAPRGAQELHSPREARKGVRASERLKNKKDKALFSPHFVKLGRRKRDEDDEPVTPQSQMGTNVEHPQSKAKKSLKEALEKESTQTQSSASSASHSGEFCG